MGALCLLSSSCAGILPVLSLLSSPWQRLDRGAVGGAQPRGRGGDHDGGGRLLHALRSPLPLPPQAGECLGGWQSSGVLGLIPPFTQLEIMMGSGRWQDKRF